jgi:hypothetical protein
VQNDHFNDLLMGHKRCWYFISKMGLKGAQIGVTPPYVVHWLINCAIFIYFREHIHCKYLKKKYILTLVLSEKKILNETKNHNPPFKLNGRSLTTKITSIAAMSTI